MNALEAEAWMNFDESLKEGDRIEARLLQNGVPYVFKAVVWKIAKKSVKVLSLEVGKPYPDESMNGMFILPRFGTGLSWSEQNGVFPLKTEETK